MEVALPPAPPVIDVGDTVRLKFCTVSETVMLCVRLPLVPVMVSVDVPPGTVVGTDTVRVEVPDPVSDAGLKAAVALAGRPLTARLVGEVSPALAVRVTVKVVAVPPATTVRVVGEEESEKSGATVRVSGTDWTMEPLVPVTDSG